MRKFVKRNLEPVVYVSSALLTLIIWLSCNQLPFSSQFTSKPVGWIEVQVGLTDSTVKTVPDSMPNDIFRYKNGFQIKWERLSEVQYYEVRASQEPITDDTWDKALLAAKIDNPDTGKIVDANVELKPEISINKCSGCKACYNACPQKAISMVNNKAFINPRKCTGCGVCYEKCTYSSVSILSAGKYFYFAVRGYSKERSIIEKIAASSKAYKLIYTNNITDSTDMKCGRCGNTCFILNKNLGPGCPVDAVHYFVSPDTTLNDYVYIDQSKCIYCGQCYIQCTAWGFHSIRKEVVSYSRRLPDTKIR